MLREPSSYDGLTYFSAAHHAGLLLHPVIGWSQQPTLCGREIYYDPELSPRIQREQIIGIIAERRASEPGGGNVIDYVHELRERLAPVY